MAGEIHPPLLEIMPFFVKHTNHAAIIRAVGLPTASATETRAVGRTALCLGAPIASPRRTASGPCLGFAEVPVFAWSWLGHPGHPSSPVQAQQLLPFLACLTLVPDSIQTTLERASISPPFCLNSYSMHMK